ncbi:DUF501 domain-containing protein [Hydrogenivirga sp. 128-5-R1-1]|uniref:DUF501 domain-containing protein n=1 Tax=Hydrogenivirga sp. 128-5-R1-1 TaxID=392423 RepID=UPI00015F0C3F|nr:DUF501 domain-containing protein [Hydrogenivirga sp. 128-5-R1-1]EDP75916.1 quinolinate synthetase [Hydrogenivirga sp. 128-5-R1-1]
MLKVVENPIVVHENGIYRPEPTRFWILDREFRSAVSRLESEGFIRMLSQEITEDEGLFDFLVKLHEREVRKREELLKKLFPEVYEGSGRWDLACKKVLLNPEIGIGGIRNFRRKPFKVRCLHLWTAYHVGDEEFRNPIGEFVLSKI